MGLPHPAAAIQRPGASALVLLAAALAACGDPAAYGEANSLILVTSGEPLWEEVRDTTFAALERTVFTVRDEKRFYVEPVDTTEAQDFRRLRTFVQVLVFGTPDNRHIREVADEAGLEDVPPDTIFQARDVWAQEQVVTAIVVDPRRPAESWRAHLPRLAEMIDRQYRSFARRRMFVSGVDSAAMDSLRRRYGFSLVFPRVYDVTVRPDGEGPVIVRNDNPDPSDLIRSVLVDWRSPPLDSLTARAAYGWRAAVDSVHYGAPQAIDTARARIRRLEVSGRPALEATGVWRDEGTGYPAGGPFVARLVDCPERTYFLDAWLYAPGRDKYQYLVQLEEIMDSFACDDAS